MAKIGPLGPGKAAHSLAQRLSPLADRLRQLNTRFGVRPYRVFLTWTKFSGNERGEGNEQLVKRTEILPTPKLDSLDSTSFSMFHAGTVPVGSVRISEISNVVFNEDLLRGLDAGAIPSFARDPKLMNDGIPQPYDFFYEVVEDDRAGPNPVRFRYRLMNKPFRQPGRVMWTLMLEKVSEDRTRQDTTEFSVPGRP